MAAIDRATDWPTDGQPRTTTSRSSRRSGCRHCRRRRRAMLSIRRKLADFPQRRAIQIHGDLDEKKQLPALSARY
ncbi:hypothetical protein KIN20_029302 [Parelaphostrongylus tenuis]|uniref:Uncharacterized protein n=1 Tax=Parelaphostrongylus tenuis TaxID=148309 RepID=A0AAD5R2B6_PARTN|nr:hypothetical protein KIN20_029302 [Parelaphostrongylus tenuis]